MTLPRRSTGARARCRSSSYPHHRRLPPPPPPLPPPPPSPCPLYVGSPVHSSASTTGSSSFACPYQTSGSIKRTVFLHPPPKSSSLWSSPCVFPPLSPSSLSSSSFFAFFFVHFSRLDSCPLRFPRFHLPFSHLSTFFFLVGFQPTPIFLPAFLFLWFHALFELVFFSFFLLLLRSLLFISVWFYHFVLFMLRLRRLRFAVHADLFRDESHSVAPFTVIRP